MKIGVFSNFYPPSERGGAELIAQRVAHELSRRGHDVFVLSTTPFTNLQDLRPRLCETHVERVYRFFPLNAYHISHASFVPFPIRLFWHIVDMRGPHPHSVINQLLEKEEPDVVLTHNLKGLGVRSALCIQKARVRHIHTLHDVQLTIPSGVLMYGQEDKGLNRGRLRSWYERMAKQALGLPDVVISPSRFLADLYRSRGFFEKTQMEIIPNPTPHQRDIVGDRPLRAGPLKILFVGQLETHKGVLLLLEAIARVSFAFELHIVGDGSMGSSIANLVKEDKRIFLHGFISLEHIRHLMATCDVVAVPSLCYENSPTIIYESFQSGLPVIASRIGGIPELVKEGVNGLLFEPGSAEAFAQALTHFANERDTFFSRQSVIREEAQQYSLSNYVNRLESLLS